MVPRAKVGSKLKRTRRRVFISYSRKDGSRTAYQLRDALNAAGCDTWLDAERVRGGASWSKDIEDALNKCDVLVAVISVGSYGSEICRAEHMWALDEGKHVIPVLASPNARRPVYLHTLNY